MLCVKLHGVAVYIGYHAWYTITSFDDAKAQISVSTTHVVMFDEVVHVCSTSDNARGRSARARTWSYQYSAGEARREPVTQP